MATPAEKVGGMILVGLRRYQLKRVYSSASLWEAREILDLLQQQRIEATLLNENMAGMPGVLPFNARMTVDAEVWVLDSALADRSARLIAEFQAAAATQGPDSDATWHCAACREDSPAGFELCWACGLGRPHN